MAVAWTTITNGQVAAGAALTTALVTALRDNPEGIAQRASGAPKIFGTAYDYQEFTASGTWTKPSNDESGDKVYVQVVGGGGGGARNDVDNRGGGGGGGGVIRKFDDIDDLPATATIAIGAGGAGRTGSSGDGTTGGPSTFGTTGATTYIRARGGTGGDSAGTDVDGGDYVNRTINGANEITGGTGGGTTDGGSSVYGGGGGGAAAEYRGNSQFAGDGGGDGSGAAGEAGFFPGGGGQGGRSAAGGDGADGVIRVWCVREEA